MNNWLAFSLSPHELPSSQPHQSHSPSAAVSHFISGDDVSTNCYDFSADSTSEPPMGIPTLRPDLSFCILEAFNRHHHHQTQGRSFPITVRQISTAYSSGFLVLSLSSLSLADWNMKSLGDPSELSVLVGSSSNQNTMEEDEPKLEDFLGGNSISDHDQKVLPAALTSDEYMFSTSSFQAQDASMVTSDAHGGGLMSDGNGGSSSNSIGLSVIKTWLRNQPIPQQQANDMAGGGGTSCSSSAMVANVIGTLTNSQGLSLSMSTGSQSSSALPLLVRGVSGGGESSSSDNKQKGTAGGADAQTGPMEAVPRKAVDTFGQRTSIYRGVTRHRWTGRYEAHLWDNSCRREGQTRKGRQGGYDKEDKAARAYDLAALKYWGPTTTTNFPISNYEKELEEMKHMTRQEFIASLRRKSSGFSRGASIYRGVTRHHQHGRWQARIGRVAGNKDLYLGTFSTQEEAAEAYDIAAIKFRGLNAVTNFDMSRYDVKSILGSNMLPVGGAAKRLKDVGEHDEPGAIGRRAEDSRLAPRFDGTSGYGASHHQGWPTTLAFHQPPPLQPPRWGAQFPYGPTRGWCKQEVATAHGLQDLHQLHSGTNTHNFFQPSSVLHHGLVSVDASSLEHSTGSNSVAYGGSYHGGGYVMPMSTVVTDQSDAANQAGCGSLIDEEGTADPYSSSRNAYYLAHQLSSGSAKAGEYAQNNAWMHAPALAMASRSNGMAADHGAPPFTVWNDA
ncbi:hypothetical protein C4D60_Mb01t10250 [Musa balbisiana]|uniref:AP2/ERF domain-containing protein n=1 Tax=Musa balbisiana TaxID=52838 RepID=A0A4S8JLG2_MUSBA|nr:hypothetical protein C4D60_Mb01t10250 [Musa balbisiana]